MSLTVRLRLQRKIEKLKRLVLSLGARVEESVHLSVKAIRLRDAELARRVVAGDREIDNMELELDEECLEILALHQPVATDLRFIVGILKINQDLERIGDMAANIARIAIDLRSADPIEVPDDYFTMAEETAELLHRTLDAFVSMDPGEAFDVLAEDDKIDLKKHKLHRAFEERVREQPEHRRALIHLFLVSRHLERIGDHTTNIAEDIIYMVTGEIVRHGQKQ
jgi:phosphate transport system protein